MSQYLLLPNYNKLNSHLPAVACIVVYCYWTIIVYELYVHNYTGCYIGNNNNTNVLYTNYGLFIVSKAFKTAILQKYANPQNLTHS